MQETEAERVAKLIYWRQFLFPFLIFRICCIKAFVMCFSTISKGQKLFTRLEPLSHRENERLVHLPFMLPEIFFRCTAALLIVLFRVH